MNIRQMENLLSSRQVGAIDKRRYYSLMILLVTEQENPEPEKLEDVKILFEERSAKLKTQPGDICFPGGRVEEGESPLACALRETEEEIGISREKIHVLGQFDTLYEVSDITMYTFVGCISRKTAENLTPNPDEVETVFTVPYVFFRDTQPLNYTYDIVQQVGDFPYEAAGIRPDYKWRKGKKTIPIYQYGDVSQRKVIWGITGRIAGWFVSEMESRSYSLASSNSSEIL